MLRQSQECKSFIGKYSTYHGTWYTENDGELASLLTDVEANWSALQLKGMSAQQVRAIPEEVLTQNLAYKDFSVVYCMKVRDVSTESYHSKIHVDYIADIFTGTGLSLKLVLAGGTEKVFSGLSESEIEDFLAWYTEYPVRRGSYIYQIKQGNEYFFANHNQIQAASLTES